ncbi:MAG: hypothetical protein P0S94_03250 [Simkaniaceae bacterium]|nr:hypothetical protein [Simkaniaceae bacterium]
MEEKHCPKHPWRARLIVAVSMMLLSFIGLIVTDVWQKGAWIYWTTLTPILAISCLWLSWYLRKKEHSLSLVNIWHEILHWAALVAAVFLIATFVKMGVLGRFEAGLVIITMLALTTFIAGIYIESSFAIIGIAMGFFAIGGALAQEYLYYMMIPVLLVLIGTIFWIVHRMKKKAPEDE